ncbi:MAG TPA: hypothetical protein VHO68_11900 [Bacteroidales bacterium]|nr:hypothetical protein [Bacteroidales bacterium]
MESPHTPDKNDNVQILSPEQIGKNFIPAEFLPEGKDEYYLRDLQTCKPEKGWRHLRSDEVERLVKNDNKSDNWDSILVTDYFEPEQIKNSQFFRTCKDRSNQECNTAAS